MIEPPPKRELACHEDVMAPLEERVQRLFASDPETLRDPYPLYRELRERAPVYEIGPMVLIPRHRDAARTMLDVEHFESGAGNRGSRWAQTRAEFAEHEQKAYDELTAFEAKSVTRSNADDHRRLRAIVHRAFTPRQIGQLRESIESYAATVLAPLVGEEVSDLTTFAYRLPLLVIADIVCVPDEDIELIRGWTSKIARFKGGVEPDRLVAAHAALCEFRRYLEELLKEHRRRPVTSELLATLFEAEADGRMSAEELTVMCSSLLIAGHETTTNLIGIGLVELLRNRDQWQMLCADQDLAPRTVEELLRYVSPVQWTRERFALDGAEIAGVCISAGTTVTVMVASANRDPEAFTDPERLNILRPDSKNHLGFGLGPHFCLGAALARLEADVAFRTMARRFPNMELAVDTETLQWEGNAMLRHLKSIPVALGVG